MSIALGHLAGYATLVVIDQPSRSAPAQQLYEDMAALPVCFSIAFGRMERLCFYLVPYLPDFNPIENHARRSSNNFARQKQEPRPHSSEPSATPAHHPLVKHNCNANHL